MQACVALFSLPFGQELVPASPPAVPAAPAFAHRVPERGQALSSACFTCQVLVCALTDPDQSQVLQRQSPAQVCALAVLWALPQARSCSCASPGVPRGAKNLWKAEENLLWFVSSTSAPAQCWAAACCLCSPLSHLLLNSRAT